MKFSGREKILYLCRNYKIPVLKMGSQLCFAWINNRSWLNWYSHLFVDGIEPDKQNVFTRLLHGKNNFTFRWLMLKEKLYIDLRFWVRRINKQNKPKVITLAMVILFGELFLSLGGSCTFWFLRHLVFLFYKYQYFSNSKRRLTNLKEQTYLIELWTRNVWVELENFKVFAVQW